MRRVKARAVVTLAGVGLLVAAGALALRERAPTAADCATRYGRDERVDCLRRAGLPDDALDSHLRALLRETSDSTQRDLLVLRLVMEDPRRGRWACPDVVDAKMQSWCVEVQRRTHLLSEPG